MSEQTKLNDPQQISFVWKRDEANGGTMFFIIKKSEKTTFNSSQNSVTIIQIMETQKTVNLLNGSDNESSKFATKKMIYYWWWVKW